ncbi:MAG: hypothetical protein KIS66_13865 [Fimbriimonadaceae bacterium]|nr:hypothetical protein [Fimbriimonadaceae bacterium]
MFDIERLIEEYTPEPGPFPVVLPKGEVLTFRPISRHGEWERLKERAAGWVRDLPKPGEDVGHPFEGLVPEDAGDAFVAYLIAELSVEPKIGLRDALRMLRAPMLADHVYQSIRSASKELDMVRLADRVEASKKKRAETEGTDSDSPSRP